MPSSLIALYCPACTLTASSSLGLRTTVPHGIRMADLSSSCPSRHCSKNIILIDVSARQLFKLSNSNGSLFEMANGSPFCSYLSNGNGSVTLGNGSLFCSCLRNLYRGPTKAEPCGMLQQGMLDRTLPVAGHAASIRRPIAVLEMHPWPSQLYLSEC